MLGPIELTGHEATLAAQVREADRLLLHEHNVERTRNAGFASCELMGLLLKRNAIPDSRLRYLTDERYNGSNPRSSRLELFRRNAHSNAEMYEHPHFWKYLQYFLWGAKLPETVISQFSQLAAEKYRDHGSLEKMARQLSRTLSEDNAAKAEEFFKLAIDCDCTVTEAMNVRRAVLSVR
jgi:hypothetical protein